MLASPMRAKPSRIILATARVRVGVVEGRSVEIRALLDQGSEMSFISEYLAQVLRVKRIRMPTSVSAVGCVDAGTFKYAARICVSHRDVSSPTVNTTALILSSLTAYAPQSDADIASFSHLADLAFADPDPTSKEPIHLILGADLYGEVILGGLRKGSLGEPIAQDSIFGWVISGPLSPSSPASPPSPPPPGDARMSHHVSVHHCLNATSLEDEIRRFWEIEDFPTHLIATPDDEKCETHFRSTHTRTSTGRYIVRLPFRRDPPIEIGESRQRAEQRLNALFRRFGANPKQFAEYQAFIREYERLGHLRKLPAAEDRPDPCVYLPHHPVFRDSSSTTRLRVVFDASSLTSNGSSLNNHLLTGPKLQTDLSAVILRWRQFRFVYAADIAKMYRQILVDDRDLNFQRILWRDSSRESASDYQLLTVTYGMACAPFLALRVIQQLAQDEGERYPMAVPILQEHIYVDDVLFGHDDLNALRATRDQLISLLRCGGFELRKWAANSAALLFDIDDSEHGTACDKSLSHSDNLNILGVEWNPVLDSFQIRVSMSDDLPRTKRSILAAIARLYDPLGWVTPVILSAKVLMQTLWRDRFSWDEPIPPSLSCRWQQICDGISRLSNLRLPRWSGFTADCELELHGFADASTVAYAAAVYLKVVDSSQTVTISLLLGKSRVAPLKPLSIPRLELLGAALLARLINLVKTTLAINDLPCFCWSDSTVVLAWLRQHPSRWKTFVANRVADIQQRLPGTEWRLMPKKLRLRPATINQLETRTVNKKMQKTEH
ncbi:uncharacterized protein LOC116851276 [Odontomachus brunneus]|uniref:uncharacterized protein LOC116851276 n=1 Tax=Odontomachus brunneus TaxID=486640 RepID=UPI0013F1E94C|nr:uncharacterized protein LOC116851276 [Odontomachus brunneus]